MKKMSFRLLAISAMALLLSAACTKEPADGPNHSLEMHTICLDFENAFPHHSEVSARLTINEWSDSLDAFIKHDIQCDISDSVRTCSYTYNSKSTISDCVLEYFDFSHYHKTFSVLFGSWQGDDKVGTVAFDQDRTYKWNDNATYMVLQ